MLSKNQMVKTRRAIEQLYDGICTVSERIEYEKQNGAHGFHETVTLIDEPCHLSFSNMPATINGDAAASVSQVTKLFLSPEVSIPAGSKITVEQNGMIAEYENAGVSARYSTHQEIVLNLVRRWA